MSFQVNAQTLSGHLPGLSGEPIKLIGFKGLDSYLIDSTGIQKNGSFQLSFKSGDYGMGLLLVPNLKPFSVVLCGEQIKLRSSTSDATESMQAAEGEENKRLGTYLTEHARREQALSAWTYLYRIYSLDKLFTPQADAVKSILKEKKRIKEEDNLFLSNLPKDFYIAWYLPKWKLIQSAGVIARERTEEINPSLAAFRALDYRDARLYKSGLLRDALESHFWLIENGGRSLDSVYIEMKISIDRIIENLLPDQNKLNEISEYLFQLLEKRSVFKASEYLALRLLNEKSCTLDHDLSAQLESYRAMKIGNTAPDFDFRGDVFAPMYQKEWMPQKLSDLKSEYTAIVFGASWCPQCPPELSTLVRLYPSLKSHQIEVVFASLDETASAFNNFASVFPFISICDYNKWESPIVKNYHVFSTPTIYLLNSNREIILRPHSVSQLASWVDWYVVKGNK
jgi:thiol-disulfide isomerase/thioredoxin